ncbi:MAG: glutamate-1-semialdehyde 2,1-aminomutase [Myxococcales bacterium]|nr:glutamate-1-semialdehyde 2,1-aminomutase [Myxococcales bacterium]
MTDERSRALYAEACEVLPGGVNSPVRAFKSVGSTPVFVKEARGATLVGADGREYVDYVGSWGPMILGHAHPEVLAAITDAASRGTSFGAPTEGEIRMAEDIRAAYPHMEMSRMVSSGTEATMGALRLARGYTGRSVVVKCIGGYHGGADYLLVKAGSGLATLGEPDSAGVPPAIAATTISIHYNDLDGAKAAFAERGDEIAAVIIEPVAGNMGCVGPEAGWLEGLKALCDAHGALLIFDEVMCGFRVAYGGAQERFGVTPHLTCLGKIVGGGLPAGAYGGPKTIMSKVAPLGPVYQAGTLSGNPLAVAAGRKTLELLRAPGTYEKLEAIGAELEAMLVAAAKEAGVTCTVQRVGAMITPFFHDGAVRSWREADQCDRATFGRWHAAMLEHGVHWPPSQFEAAFPSLAHDADALAKTRAALGPAFAAARG